MDPELEMQMDTNAAGAGMLTEMMTQISPSALIAGLVFGVIGLILFKRGKKRLNYVWVSVGIVMMLYPLFVWESWKVWGVGFVLSGVAYYYR